MIKLSIFFVLLGRKFLHGRPFLRVQTNQQAQPHIQQEFPTNKGNVVKFHLFHFTIQENIILVHI